MIRLDKNFLAVFVAVAVIFSIASIYYYGKSVQRDASISWVDFRVYYYAGFGVESKANIYHLNDGYFIYKYSPIFALMMSVIKFSTITSSQALCVWYIVLFIAFVLSLYLAKEVTFAAPRCQRFGFFDIVPILFLFRYLILINFTSSYLPRLWPLPVKIFDILLFAVIPFYIFSLLLSRGESQKGVFFTMAIVLAANAKYLIHNIDRAQVNIVILALLMFFVYYLIKKRDILAGVYLGVAVVFKLVPSIFLIYIIMKRRMKAFFSTLAVSIILLFIPAIKWGSEYNTQLLKSWLGALRLTVPTEYLDYKNQSLLAMISRFFSENSDVAITGFSDSFLAYSIAFVYALALILLMYAVIKIGNRKEGSGISIYDLSLFFMTMTILSPVGSATTFVYTLLPIAVLAKEAFERRFRDIYINTGLFAFIFFGYLNTTDLIGDLSIVLRKYSLMTFCLIALFALLVYVKISKRPLPQSSLDS